MGVEERGQEDGNHTRDHSANPANFSENFNKVGKEKIKIVTVKECVSRG